ncbi:hypothetical protein GCM10023333_02290 [Ferrimonas pelagia]|uniref:Uncharacterized protein n=1 Tax=Ferrimonas pelagia TaxID=1177826 RepID=A0ABP9EF45_9GAMM
MPWTNSPRSTAQNNSLSFNILSAFTAAESLSTLRLIGPVSLKAGRIMEAKPFSVNCNLQFREPSGQIPPNPIKLATV